MGGEAFAAAVEDRIETEHAGAVDLAAGDVDAAGQFDAVVVDGRSDGHDPSTVNAAATAAPGTTVVYVTDGAQSEVTAAFERGATSVVRADPDETPKRRVAGCVINAHTEPDRASETLDALHGATRQLIRADDPREVVDVVVDTADRILGFAGVSVRLVDESGERLRAVSFGGPSTEVIDELPDRPVDDSPHGRALRTGETVVRMLDEDDPDPFARTMYVPVGDHGVLSVGWTDRGPFDVPSVQFAEILAENTAVALDAVERERDLCEQRARLRERSERLDEFASVVAHDLRNPMNVALGRIDMARESGDVEGLDTASRAIHRMDRLVEDALSLAKEPEVDDPAPVALGRLAAETWERQYAGEDATLNVRIDPDRAVRADRACLERLVDNLLGNAVEHGGEDVTVWLETVDVDPDEGLVEPGFAVSDDGAGIDADRRETVMEKGFTTSREGTGLGLAIVHDMAALHGWTVEVAESTAGGARFVVRGVEWTD